MPFINDLVDHNRDRLSEASSGSGARYASRFVFDPGQLMVLLRERIAGQDAVLDELEALFKVVKADIGEPERPLAVTLLMGPTGVGKTETVRLVAQALHGRPDAFCRIDMNTLAQEHYAAALTGAPPGYVGSKEGTTLFDAEAIAGSFSRPGIVLFDEIEKASREVVRSLLGVLDSGRLTLAAGSRTLDFRNTLVFMTSNIGAEEARQYRERYRHGWRRWLGLTPHGEAQLLEQALHRHFEPEFLNRIDRILTYARIDDDQLDRLLTLELARLNRRLSRQGRLLYLDESARAWLCRGHDVRFGARGLARHLRTRLEPAIADCLLAEPAAQRLLARCEEGRLRVERVL
jgi:ATP-dependent Clp protease ATP-binding subunit ClpA